MNWVDRMKLHSPQQYASYMGGMNYNPRTGEFTERGGGDDYGGVPDRDWETTTAEEYIFTTG